MKETVLPRLEQFQTRKPSASPIWACFSRYGATSPPELHQLAICELCTNAGVYYEFKTKDGCTSALGKHLLHFHPPQVGPPCPCPSLRSSSLAHAVGRLSDTKVYQP